MGHLCRHLDYEACAIVLQGISLLAAFTAKWLGKAGIRKVTGLPKD